MRDLIGFPLADKVAIVTGAASGIGKAIAEEFARRGAAVGAFDVDGEGARATAAGIGPAGRAVSLQGDVRCEADVSRAVEQTLAQFGRLDILVNNAGIELESTVPEMPASEWDRQIEVNLKGAYLFSKYAIPRMGRGGVILNIASVHAFVSYAGAAAYDASKAALLGLTRAMALDHGGQGIRVVAVCPGYIDTPMFQQWLDEQPERDAAFRRVLNCHPLGRVGTPQDVAQACVFLASDAASFISGTHLVIDGAMTAAGH